MATERLTDDDKSTIVNKIDNITVRSLYNKKFPVDKEDIFEWVTNQMEQSHQDAYRLLRVENIDLTNSSSSWDSDFFIRSDSYTYKANIRYSLPLKSLEIRKTDPHHADVIEWIEWYYDLEQRVAQAREYCFKMVWACTSAGQIKRLFPDEALRFVPSHLLNFNDVERMSRVPRSLALDGEQLENLMNMITLGAISPEERKGVIVSIATRDYIDNED